MSELLINQYQAEIAKYIQYGGDKKETSIRRAFCKLANQLLQTARFIACRRAGVHHQTQYPCCARWHD